MTQPESTGGRDGPARDILLEREIRDREAGEYDGINSNLWWQDKVFDAVALGRLGVRGPHTVLDAGCGTGRNLPGLARLARSVIGVDHSSESLKVARTRLLSASPALSDRTVLLRADLRSLPVESESVDRLLCAGVIQHIAGRTNRELAVGEFHRVLKPGGSAVVFGYRWRRSIRQDKEGYFPNGGAYRFAFTKEEFASMLMRGGFENLTLGGAVLLPRLGTLLNLDVGREARLAFTEPGLLLGNYWVAHAVKRLR